jgi:hypothetical protein
MAIFKAIAISDSGSYLILQDEDAVYDIIEQYAAGGLMILANEMKNQGDFSGWLSSKLYTQSQNVIRMQANKI